MMTNFGIYLIKTGFVSGLFFLIYHFILRKESFFTLNRAYLLLSIAFSYLFPFFTIGFDTTTTEAIPLISSIQSTINQFAFNEESIHYHPLSSGMVASFSWWMVSLITISSIFLIQYILHLLKIKNTIKAHEKIKQDQFTIVLFSKHQTFSFFSYIFISQNVWHSSDSNSIIQHELSHIRHRHSVDRLFLALMLIVFWMNPFLYFYRRALEEVHEYQADFDASHASHSVADYFKLVLQQSIHHGYSPLISPFSYKLIKKRITMSNYKSHPIKRAILIFPIAMALLILAISASINSQDDNTSSLVPENMILGRQLEAIEKTAEKPQFILPFKKTGSYKLTSGYGMRIHPIYKSKKMHKGTDFSAELNTPVLAIADGTVRKVELNFKEGEGYGKFIIIDHANGFSSLYAQLNEYKVKEGDLVKQGQTIAMVGSSGMSTAPHLHLELKKDGESVDPMLYLKQ